MSSTDPIGDAPDVDPDLSEDLISEDPDIETPTGDDEDHTNTTGSAAGDVEADTASGGAPE